MEIVRTGIIINTEHYDACVEFYRQLFALPELFTEQHGDFRLTCFAYGESYLMIETGGAAKPEGKSVAESATKLRFHVRDIDSALLHVRSFGIDAEIERYDWGATINIHDPDGNRIGIRDEATFVAQMNGSAATE